VRISGFSFVRNAVDLYYPLVESIRSALPVCDEFVVAAGDSTDGTTELLRGLGEPKLRIIDTVWDRAQFVRGASNAVQTNIALDACRGDWASTCRPTRSCTRTISAHSPSACAPTGRSARRRPGLLVPAFLSGIRPLPERP
jgi:hypothetical protein